MRFPLLTIAFALIVAGASYAEAAPATASKKVLVSVGEINKQQPNIPWRKDSCAMIHSIANQSIPTGVHVTCRSFDALNLLDTYLNQLKADNDFHVRILRGYRDTIHIDVTNWKPLFDSDFTRLGWTFREDVFKHVSKDDAIQAAVKNFFDFVSKEESFKSNLLIAAVGESKAISYDAKERSFRSRKDKKKISSKTAYSLFEKESERKKNYLKASIEMGILLSSDISKIVAKKPANSLETLLVESSDVAASEFSSYQDVYSLNTQSLSPLSQYLINEATKQGSTWNDVSNYLGLEKGQQAFLGIETPLPQQDIVAPRSRAMEKSRSSGGGLGKLVYLF